MTTGDLKTLGGKRRAQPAPTVNAGLVQLGKKTERQAEPATERSPEERTVYLETYGCQMNVADSDLLLSVLGSAGLRRTEEASQADVILINTCAVREKAEERVYARARELSAQKKRRKGVVLGITGCMAGHLKEKLHERAPSVDIIAGPDSYRRMPALIEAARVQERSSSEPVLDIRLDKSETYEGLDGAKGGDGVSGFVTIQRGCDKFCTFCVVPFTRGRERGTSPQEVVRQVQSFADAGYREVVLLGQTVNSYTHDDVDFAGLLRRVARVDGIERIRFTSPYPVDFTPAVIEVIAEESKVCNYIHLPVQSGSDAVLQRMRRGYSITEFRTLLADLRSAVPDIAISTDILSGFCGETEKDHEETLQLMRDARFDSAFMFIYSERDLTHAAKRIPDDVSQETKKRRITEIIELQQNISKSVYAAEVGKTAQVLIHSVSKRNDNELVGRTDGFKSVVLPRGPFAPGDFVDVRIDRATMATLFGRSVEAR